MGRSTVPDRVRRSADASHCGAPARAISARCAVRYATPDANAAGVLGSQK
jgi:hypothetical protein